MSDSNITKKALGESMKDLMTRQSFQKISISDICAGCGLTRKSFYYHFQDKYDLVNWIFHNEFMAEAEKESGSGGWLFLEKLCRYFYENRRFYAGVIDVKGQNCFTDYFTDLMKPHVSSFFREYYAKAEYRDFYAVFYVDGILLAILRWLREDAETTPERFTRLLRSACVDAAHLILLGEQGARASGEAQP